MQIAELMSCGNCDTNGCDFEAAIGVNRFSVHERCRDSVCFGHSAAGLNRGDAAVKRELSLARTLRDIRFRNRPSTVPDMSVRRGDRR